MSKYVMQVFELAKKRGVPTSEFVQTLNDLGFECNSHLKKLTQEDLDTIALLFNPKTETQQAPELFKEFKIPDCASVVITKLAEHDFAVSAIRTSVVNGELVAEELERRVGFKTKAEALIESDLVAYKYKTDRL
jgi:hypothetical protein